MASPKGFLLFSCSYSPALNFAAVSSFRDHNAKRTIFYRIWHYSIEWDQFNALESNSRSATWKSHTPAVSTSAAIGTRSAFACYFYAILLLLNQFWIGRTLSLFEICLRFRCPIKFLFYSFAPSLRMYWFFIRRWTKDILHIIWLKLETLMTLAIIRGNVSATGSICFISTGIDVVTIFVSLGPIGIMMNAPRTIVPCQKLLYRPCHFACQLSALSLLHLCTPLFHSFIGL